MHNAIQTFFVVQVALEKAAGKVCETSRELVSQNITDPVQRTLTKIVGKVEGADLQELRNEVESIRAELKGLRNDIRELQRTTTV